MILYDPQWGDKCNSAFHISGTIGLERENIEEQIGKRRGRVREREGESEREREREIEWERGREREGRASGGNKNRRMEYYQEPETDQSVNEENTASVVPSVVPVPPARREPDGETISAAVHRENGENSSNRISARFDRDTHLVTVVAGKRYWLTGLLICKLLFFCSLRSCQQY